MADRTEGTAENQLRAELVRFWSQFAVLQEGGMPVLSALNAQRGEARLPEVQTALDGVITSVREGRSFSAALAAHTDVFSAHVQELARIGEIEGRLDAYSRKIAEELKTGTLPVASDGKIAATASESASERKIRQLAEALVREATEASASDIHLEPTPTGGQIRKRVDGVMQQPAPLDAETYDALVARFQIMAQVDVAEKRLPQDGRILVAVGDKTVDLRVSFMQYVTGGPRGSGYGGTLRLLTPVTVEFDPVKCGIPSEMQRWASAPWGIYIVSGPTGCGKTTILYSLLKLAATPGRKTLTAENPVEYLIPGVQQAELRSGIGLTFPLMIRSFLRQDPDVIMVGEIRDRETATLLPIVAMTGHLVLTTLHTVNAMEVPRRLIDLGVEPWLVQESLKGAASLRLLRRLCPECKFLDDRDLSPLLEPLPHGKELSGKSFFRAQGCPACHGAGYRGRVPIYEVLPLTDRIKNGIARDVDSTTMRKLAVEEGIVTLRQAAMRKAAEGVTSVDEALRVTNE